MEREPQPAHTRLSARQVLAAIAGRLAEANPYRVCQYLEKAAPHLPPLGSSHTPANDPVRFRPVPGLGFPCAELKGVEALGGEGPATVRTWLLGLYGVDSPLPSAYLDDIAQRREGHEALKGFLDIFNHRVFTQFYRIWRKYSYPATFEPGGRDATSQCLLGLIGLGIPGTAERIETPVSRFLALLGVMRLPTRHAEGVRTLVALLARRTQARVIPHWPRRVPLAQPPGLGAGLPVRLGQGMPLAPFAIDANSQILLVLSTTDFAEAQGWLPGGALLHDLQVLLRVYLGWRCNARLRLELPRACLPTPLLGEAPLRLGETAVLPLASSAPANTAASLLTIPLGGYAGLSMPWTQGEVEHVTY